MQDPSGDGRLVAGLYVRNPFNEAIITRLNVIQPKGWKVSLGKYVDGRPFELKAGAEEPVEIKVALHSVWNRRWLALAVAWGICLIGWLVVALIDRKSTRLNSSH